MTWREDLIEGLSEDTIQALADGRHGDPFAILGPHRFGDGTVVRALFPGARAVSLVDRESGGQLAVMERVHDAGLFAAWVPGSLRYRFRIEWPEAIQETEDPYSFGFLLGDLDLHLIGQGTHYDLGRTLGAVPMEVDEVHGTRFAVWAPNARRVSVVGDFNAWDGRRHPMRLRRPSGIWEIFVPRLGKGERYKFELIDRNGNLLPQKADPVARASEAAPSTASIVASSMPFSWSDEDWMRTRGNARETEAAMSIYEVHLGSWLRIAEEGHRSLDWIELSQRLIPYAARLGFTHIELLPIMEHPFGGSWGYQPLGLFAPTGRFGTPEDFAYFVNRCHEEGIGVILDWVPAHFPTDIWGLARFDGTALYEHEDPREGFHRDWNTLIYNLGRSEVKGFLIASALEWLERYHVDGLRVDAVASMLYRDYSRNPGEWVPNREGGRENLESIEFFKHLNGIIRHRVPSALTIAEESTVWPGVTCAPEDGGLGFDFKWNMGWMHDTLSYMAEDPINRRHHHGKMSFGMVYAYSERFLLPLSHDEVVHGKRSLLHKMPGDGWQRLANLRAYYAFMWAHPGKKLLFMGCEIGQETEWNHDASVTWDLLDRSDHSGLQRLIRDLNLIYRGEPAMSRGDLDPGGFEWAVVDDADNSVFAMLRLGPEGTEPILAISNFTPVPRGIYRVGVSGPGIWREILNTDADVYGGSNIRNGLMTGEETGAHGKSHSIAPSLPPLSTIYLRRQG